MTKDAGMDTQTMVAMIVLGSLVLLGLTGWLVLGYFLFAYGSNSIESQLGKLAAAVGTAGTGFMQLRSQMSSAKKKMLGSTMYARQKFGQGVIDTATDHLKSASKRLNELGRNFSATAGSEDARKNEK